MSEKAKKVELTETVEATTVENAVVLTNDSVSGLVQAGSLGDALKSLKPVGYSLTAEYLEMSAGETRRFVVVQHQTMTVEGDNGEKREVPSVIMIDEDNNTVKAAQTVLVGALKGCPTPYPIEVTCIGDVKMQGGRKYTKFEILPLS